MDKKAVIMKKRGQIAIFVIIAVVIVVALALLFLFSKKIPFVGVSDSNIQSVIEKCTRQAVDEAVDKMLPQGGFIEPNNFRIHDNDKVSYICQHTGYYKPCVNQHPLLLNEEKNEIKNYISPRVISCFDSFKKDSEKRGSSVSYGDMKMEIDLASNKILVKVERKTSITDNKGTVNFDKFDVDIMNPLYDLSKVAIEIGSQEAKYCYFEYVGYMALYPRFDIRKDTMSDSTRIYTLEDKYSNKVMNIATRGCAIPAGI